MSAPRSLQARLFDRRTVKPNGCWIWTGSQRAGGYGQIWTSKADGPRRLLSTHRAMYELSRGAIADGLDLDHLCRVRLCMNPEHLEPVTRRQNILRGEGLAARNARKVTCRLGHPLVRGPSGKRRCPTCITDRRSAARAEISAA